MRRNRGPVTRKAISSLFILILMCWSAVTAAAAQDLVGNISGAVAASSGARLQDVQVHIANTQTGLDRIVKTNDKGEYNLFGIPVGTYSVTFTKTGFKSEVHSQIAVTAGATTTVSVALQVGSVETSIDVVASPLLNRADTTNGYALESSTIEAVPLGTGSFTQLAVLTPGVSADVLTGSGTNAGLGNQAIWANGQRSTSNSFSFNGVNSDNLFNGTSSSAVGEAQFLPNTGEVFLPGGLIQTNTSVYDAIGEGLPTPPPETIEEMKVDASMYDASEGASSGAHISVITKSGTNDLHGQLYWYTQNSAFNAAPFFYDASAAIPAGQKVPELQRNTYGVTLGGPLIPNKLLYFFSYQGLVDHDQLSGTAKLNVPLALTNNRSAAALEQEFNVPSIDPVALNLLNAQVNGQYLIPSPTIATAAQAQAVGYDVLITGKPDFYTNQLNYNVDYNVSSIDRLSMKYYYQEDPTVSPFATSSLSGFPQTLTAGGQVFSLQNSRILSPTLTWEQSLGFTRQVAFSNVQQAISPGEEAMNLYGASLFPKITISQADPTLKKSLAFGTGGNFSNGGVFQNEYTYDTNFYWVFGNHTVETGAHYSRSQLNVVNHSNEAASFTVATWAAFLAGTVKSGQILQGSTNRYYRANTGSAFVQDNWRISPRINVNYGLRWDYDGPLSELHGMLDNFDPSLYSYNSTTDTVTNDGLVVAGNNPQYATQGVSASTLTQHQWGFAPRLGITWSPMANNNLVIRAGGGIYYDRGEFFSEFSPGAGSGISGPLGVTQELPFVQVFKSPGGSTLDSPLGATAPNLSPGNPALFAATIPNLTATAACPVGDIPGPLGCGPNNVAPNTSNGGSSPAQIGGYGMGNKLPYSENWTVNLQWQPTNTIATSIGYTGNHGVHELLPIPINQPQIATPQTPVNGQIYSYGYNPCISADANCSVSSGNRTPKFPNAALVTEPYNNSASDFDGGNVDLRVPYIGYSPNLAIWQAEGISNYNSLQFSVNKRISRGLQFSVSYTWSHALDEGSGLGLFYDGNNPNDPKQAYATSDFDRTHVAAISYLYQLPKAVASNQSFAGEALNGWQLNGVIVLESDLPYSVWDYTGGAASIYYSSNDLITNPLIPLASGQTPQTALSKVNGLYQLNPAAFAPPLVQPGTSGVPPCGPTGDGSSANFCDSVETTYGTAARNNFRGPFQRSFNMSLGKNFQLSEKLTLRYQLDAFNVFNTPSFDAPDENSEFNSSFADSPTYSQSPNFGLTTNTLGSSRFLQMSLHVTF